MVFLLKGFYPILLYFINSNMIYELGFIKYMEDER